MGSVDVIEFGAHEYPDKVFSVMYSKTDPGYGIGISTLKNPGSIQYGERITEEDKNSTELILWFYREDSVDVLIRNLKRIKERFKEKT